jgi:hypothetical protein
MNNKFFTLIRPYLGYIDSGKMFREPIGSVYIILAILNLVFPIYVLIKAIKNHIFQESTEIVSVFIVFWIILGLTGWISFQLWWDRNEKINKTSKEGDDFTAIPVYSHFIQTLGEWFGTYIAIIGFFFGIGTAIVKKSDLIIGQSIPGASALIGGGVAYGLLSLLAGYLIIFLSRAAAEMLRAVVSIANNTRK